MNFNRVFNASELLSKKSFFLFGPRNTGETTLLDQREPERRTVDGIEILP